MGVRMSTWGCVIHRGEAADRNSKSLAHALSVA